MLRIIPSNSWINGTQVIVRLEDREIRFRGRLLERNEDAIIGSVWAAPEDDELFYIDEHGYQRSVKGFWEEIGA